jgi:hypothetical protein
MKITPRHVVQLSSAEIGFLHGLVRRQVRSFVAEHAGSPGLGAPPPELTSLERRLLARLGDAAAQEAIYFTKRCPRAEGTWIREEHAVLAEVAARQDGAFPLATPLPPDVAAHQAAPWASLKRARQHAAS